MPVKNPKKVKKVKLTKFQLIQNTKVEASPAEITRLQELGSAKIFKKVFDAGSSYSKAEDVINDQVLLNAFNKIFKKGGKPVYYFDKVNLLSEKSLPVSKRSLEYQWIETFYAQQAVMVEKFDPQEWTIYNREGGFMDYITDIVKTEFKEKISKKDAWNPADIWLVRNQANIKKKIKNIVSGPRDETSIVELNAYLTTLYKNARRSGTKGDALTGISLKKVSGKTAVYEEVNLNSKYFDKILLKENAFLYHLSGIRINFQIERAGKNWRFETQDTVITLKNYKDEDKYKFQVKGNNTSSLANLKFEGTAIGAASSRLGKAPVDLMEKISRQHGKPSIYDTTSKSWTNYPTTYNEWANKTDGNGHTYLDYVGMFSDIKSKKFGMDKLVDTGGVNTITEFEENFDHVFQDVKLANGKLKVNPNRHIANCKLIQLRYVWKLLTIFSKAKRDKYLTDVLYIAQKKGKHVFTFGPFGKLS